MTVVLWIAAITLIVIGVVGTVVPALPGVILVFAGIAFAAWIDDFARIPVWVVVVLGVLTAIAWAVDYAAAALGAKRAGASPRAIVGAAIVEYSAQRDLRQAGKVGIATWVGLLLGTAAKIAIVFAMIGIFIAALLV